MWRVVLILMVCWRVGAATYFVRPDGNDGNSGTVNNAGGAWKTVSHAAATAVAGDVVKVTPGSYHEAVFFQNNGSAGNPITFTGERAGDGSWLSEIDPNDLYTNGWVAATEIGSGIWKQPSLAHQPLFVTISNKVCAFLESMGDISAYSTQAYTNATLLGLTSGSNFLKLATNVTLYTSQSSSAIKSWDGVEAMCGTLSNANLGTWSLYFRQRTGASPDGLLVRVAPDPTTVSTWYGAKSYLVISNLSIRATTVGAFFNDAACHHNTFISNFISGGSTSLSLQGGSHNNLVINNELTGDYYGYNSPGAWGISVGPDYPHVIRENLYLVSKFLMGQSTTDYIGIQVYEAGNSNTITGNHIYNSIGSGISIRNDALIYGYETNLFINGNTIANQTSEGIEPSMGIINCRIYDNLISDNNINLRFHFLEEPGDSNRLVYIYRNSLYLPTSYGDHTFTWSQQVGTSNENATVWLYWNSFSGGAGVLRDNSFAQNNGGLPGFRYLNNIISGTLYVDPNSWGLWMWTNPAAVGLFDYNLVAPLTPTYIDPNPKAAWWSVHNITNATPQWANVAGMNFLLPSGSSAIDAALDVTVPFTDGASYSALPNTAIAKTGPQWDMGAFEYQNPQTNSVARITNFHVKKTKVGP